VFEALNDEVRGTSSSFNHGTERMSLSAALVIPDQLSGC
jgi:hypothetical protein